MPLRQVLDRSWQPQHRDHSSLFLGIDGREQAPSSRRIQQHLPVLFAVSGSLPEEDCHQCQSFRCAQGRCEPLGSLGHLGLSGHVDVACVPPDLLVASP